MDILYHKDYRSVIDPYLDYPSYHALLLSKFYICNYNRSKYQYKITKKNYPKTIKALLKKKKFR